MPEASGIRGLGSPGVVMGDAEECAPRGQEGRGCSRHILFWHLAAGGPLGSITCADIIPHPESSPGLSVGIWR